MYSKIEGPMWAWAHEMDGCGMLEVKAVVFATVSYPLETNIIPPTTLELFIPFLPQIGLRSQPMNGKRYTESLGVDWLLDWTAVL